VRASETLSAPLPLTTPPSADRSWQHPWLRLHLVMRDLLATPWRGNGAIIKRELEKRRVLDIDKPLRVAGWVLIPPDRRSASRDSDRA
jgi:hypothetical protein